MGFNVNLTSLEDIRKQLMGYVASRYGVEVFNTTTAGFLVDLVAVLLSYMQLSRSVFLREANLDTALNPANFYELASNYGYLLSPCRTLVYKVKYVKDEPVVVRRWDVVGSVGSYDVVVLEDKVLYKNDTVKVGVGIFEDSEVVATKDFDTVYVMNKGVYLAEDELERFNMSAYPFDVLKDPQIVLRSAGLHRTKLFFGTGVFGGFLTNYPLRYRRLSFNEDIRGVSESGMQLEFDLQVVEKVQENTFYPTVEEFRSSIARYSIDKRLVSEQDLEYFVKEFYDVKDCKVYNVRGGEVVVRFISLDEYLNNELVKAELDKRQVMGAVIRVYKEDIEKGQELEVEVRTEGLSVVNELEKLIVYKYLPVRTEVNEVFVNKVLYDSGIRGYVVEIRNPVVIQKVVDGFGYGFLKGINVKVRL